MNKVDFEEGLSRLEHHLVVDGEQLVHEKPGSVCAALIVVAVLQQPDSLHLIEIDLALDAT